MSDQSYLDHKYFIDDNVYNCAFCNRRNVTYSVLSQFKFNWSEDKVCTGIIVRCNSCYKKSMHLSYSDIILEKGTLGFRDHAIGFVPDIDIDSNIFYSVPTSFFTLDDRIKHVLRELITEAEGCLKMNFLTGASACTRKAIYELLIIEKSEGTDYESRIKSLKARYVHIDPSLFDILSHIQDMTSDKIHEQSWDEWDSKNLKLILETLKAVLYEIYVLPKIKAERSVTIMKLKEEISKEKQIKKVR